MNPHIHADRIAFLPGARDYADQWLFPAGTGRNQDHFSKHVRYDTGIAEEVLHLLYTPETSGGLLAAIPSSRLNDPKAGFANANHPLWTMGEARDGTGIDVGP